MEHIRGVVNHDLVIDVNELLLEAADLLEQINKEREHYKLELNAYLRWEDKN